MVRRSINMSQWVRAGLTFLATGAGPSTISAIAPSTRHSQVDGISASCANGIVKVCPFGHA